MLPTANSTNQSALKTPECAEGRLTLSESANTKGFETKSLRVSPVSEMSTRAAKGSIFREEPFPCEFLKRRQSAQTICELRATNVHRIYGLKSEATGLWKKRQLRWQ
ncbi:hypothetical protein Aduo_018447 [Ancylostoma duodenale]